ncbi:hypothetical protein [Oryzobacter terrae]|uniref:hypothetical protein n=1 Tax=Oryzobacter terrae TaxID=1620385 RepID=UPI003672A0EE
MAKGGFYKPWMGYAGAAFVALLIGMGIGGSGDAEAGTGASASGPTVTVTSKSGSTSTATATVTAGPTPTATVTATTKVTAPPPAPVAAITEGTWTVGTDIKAGTYKVIDTLEGDCYWKISRTGSNGDDIISNDIPTGGRPQVVLKKGQDFQNRGCGDWKRIK